MKARTRRRRPPISGLGMVHVLRLPPENPDSEIDEHIVYALVCIYLLPRIYIAQDGITCQPKPLCRPF